VDRLDERGSDATRFISDLVVGEAEGGHAGHDVSPVPAGVTGLGRGSSVIAEPVRLHDQPEFRPEEVHLESVDPLFAEWHRQLCFSDDATKMDLQVRVRELEKELVEQVAEGTHSRLPSVPPKLFSKSLRIDQSMLVGIVYRSLERKGR
jgi:hypothetical protein